MSENDVDQQRPPVGSDGAPTVVVTPTPRTAPAPAPGTAASQGAERANAAAAPTLDAPSTGGVNTLRAILLGGPPRTPDDARLTAIERRLDTLSLQVARAPAAPTASTLPPAGSVPLAPIYEARLTEMERRLDAQGARLDAAGEAARGGDVTLGTLSTLQGQVEALRQEHAHMAEQTAARLRETDERCQLRQLRVRTTRRQELQRLRRRVYAPAETLTGSARWMQTAPVDDGATGAGAHIVDDARATAAEAPAPVWPVVPDTRPPVVAVSAGSSALVARSAAVPAHGVEAERAEHATIRRELDMDGAWRVLGRSLLALFHALATVVLVLARLAGNDLRAAWTALVGLVRGRREDDEDFDSHHDYRN